MIDIEIALLSDIHGNRVALEAVLDDLSAVDEIVQGYLDYQDEHRKEVLLFSNDTGFVERANDAGVKAQKVAFPSNVPKRATVQWETLCDLLYVAAIIFGVLVLPKATLYGVWNGKDGSHWKNQRLVIENRSPKLEAQLDRDHRIVDAYTE